MTARTSLPPLDAETLAALTAAEGYALVVVSDGRARVVLAGAMEADGVGTATGSGGEIAWNTSSAVTVRAARPATVQPSASGTGAYDFLWGSTVHAHVSTAAVAVQPESDAGTAAADAATVESDAATVEPDAATVVPDAVPLVAPAAAPTPAPASASAPAPTSRVARTAMLSTGQSVRIDGTVVFGRSPGVRPGLHAHPLFVAVPSPLTDISRNHLELWLEDDVVLARDLGSTNGTTLHRAGERSVRVPVDVPTLVRAGDVYDLGEGVLVSFGAEGAA